MKLNRDNYEMHMFDLLEGNLSVQEELQLMKQIEADEFFFKEWKLFTSSIVIADKDVVFTNKDALLKEEKKPIVIPMYTRWVAVAASVCIFAAAWILWPKSTTPSVVNHTVPTEVEESLDTTTSRQNTAMENEISLPKEEKVVMQSPKKDTRLPHSKSQYVAPQKEHMALEKECFPKDVIDIEDPVEEIPLDIVDEKEDVPVVIAQEGPKETENLEIVEPNEEVYVADNDNVKEKLLAFVTNDPIGRIKNTAGDILAKVKDPKVKLARNNGGTPGLSLQVETSGYVAIASLHPFKNRN